MLQYGAYAKEYFDKTDVLDDLGDVDISVTEPVFNLPEGVTYEWATLSLKSETTLSLYFKSKKTFEFSVDGKTVETVPNGSYQVARIRGIAASELQNSFTLTVTAGETSGTATFSPMNYCYNALNGGTQDGRLVNALKALYQYSQAAKEYF